MKTRILVIEDNPDNLELMTYLLKQHKCFPLSAIDGVEGLNMIQQEKPDLVICDIQLPKMNGLEVAHKIKNDPQLKNIPLIAVTAYAMVGDRDKILLSGFDGYISKPIDPQIFISQIDRFLLLEKSDNLSLPEYDLIDKTENKVVKNINHKGKVLVIDDTADNRELSRTLLESIGFNVIMAENVEEVLANLDNILPDLIVTDFHLPGMSGLEFLKLIKSNPKFEKIPFIFFSSSTTEHEKEKALKFGSIKYISRPIEPQIFLQTIEKIWLAIQKDLTQETLK